MKRIILLLGIYTMSVFAFAQSDRRSDKTIITIATFNAEFLWDGREPEEGTVDLPYRGNPAEAEAHMADVAEVIKSTNADIVNLVELENIEALTILNNKFLSGLGYKPYLIKGIDYNTGQDVGLLTRVDPMGDKVERYAAKGVSGSVEKAVSKNYYAKFQIDGRKIALIGLHFLAGPNRTDRQAARQAQANAMTTLARQLASEGFSLVVCGDFNDYDGQVLDHISNVPITSVLSEIKEMDPSSNSDNLTNVASFLSQSERYTAFWDKNDNNNIDFPNEYTSIDHILISPSLVNSMTSVKIFHEHDPRLVSDHFPVVVKISTGAVAPVVTATRNVRMVSMVPNPSGDETQNESITIKNFGSSPVDVTGWKVRDLANQVWILSGTLQPNEQKVVKRSGQRMGMNNAGDTIELLSADESVIQSFTYFDADEDAKIVVDVNQF